MLTPVILSKFRLIKEMIVKQHVAISKCLVKAEARYTGIPLDVYTVGQWVPH